jgi:hypothetical protein
MTSKMRKIYTILFNLTMMLLGLTAMQSCQNDLDAPDTQGGLRVSLNNISSSVTRSTPSELGIPSTDMFKVKVEDTNGKVKYNGAFSDDVIKLAGGTYTVTAECGENPILALDQPYYVGNKQVAVVADEITEASIDCKVGNALISVVFGQNEEERVRFSKFYKQYGLNVKVGDYIVTIPCAIPELSAYFRAGTAVGLEFSGVLKDTEKTVSCNLDVSAIPNFPKPFQAADHAIITLTLPDPESVAVVDIAKVELQEATMEETIPLSWLPVPKVTATHQYDGSGTLVGTNLAFQDSYFGMKWKAVVTNSSNKEVRTVQGTNALSSVYSSSQDWPYLPKGNYTATYYLVKEGEQDSRLGSRTFTVDSPDRLKVAITGGYSSYTKYLTGDVDGANACDAFTIYQPTASFALSSAIANGTNYKNLSYEFSSTIDGTAYGSKKTGTKNQGVLDNATGLTPSLTAHVIGVNAKFDGGSASTTGNFYITGLPMRYAPPSTGEGWSSHGTVKWDDSDNGEARVRLGQNTVSQPQYIESSRIAVPSETVMECPYKVRINGATVQTTLTLSVGNYEYFSEKTTYMTGKTIESTAKFTLTSDATSMKANNSYGSGQTKSWIYYLTYKYGKK